ncbi:MAG: hypothetical protein KDD11_22905 [Acidobacteria bacterium]|nr:hypothetical protein [Acidobacteriota bacterium]
MIDRTAQISVGLLAMVLAALVSCGPRSGALGGSDGAASSIPSEAELHAWGLPGDLAGDTLEHLKVLLIPARVERVDWLPPSVETLIVRGPEAPVFRELPAGLKLLDLNQTGIEQLPALPKGLETLDVRHSAIETVEELPKTVTRLAVSGTQVSGLEGQPCYPTLQGLALERPDGMPAGRRRDLSYLPLGLRELVLVGPYFEGLGGLPPTVSVLVLDGTKVKNLAGSEQSVRTLQLLDNFHLKPQELPPLLEDLVFSPSVNALPFELAGAVLNGRYLQRLLVRRGEVGDLTQLPPTVVYLGLPLESTGELLDRWEELRQTNGSMASVSDLRLPLRRADLARAARLPVSELDIQEDAEAAEPMSSLRFAELQGTAGAGLRLPSVRRLSLSSLHSLAEIDGLASTFPNLEELFVQGTKVETLGTLPPHLRLLDLRGTKVSLLAGLPESLEVLAIHPDQVSSLGTTLPNLRALFIAGPEEPLIGLSGRWESAFLGLSSQGP